ncbi:Phosphate-repressible phosphate permease pho-4 [Thalictrum thalictroides]|uniref:Phosphate transporter n=1 Tax=Thalictrum thalictroides TaxID=46969 RepID=A0A7J6VFW2_THATH|nr:Phosphate-repressible phosphate permease pho-4 [Thalictrum thalictroides]
MMDLFSTLVGSGALTLIQATLAASVIYVPGTAFASNSTLDALFWDFLKEKQPNEGFLMWSLVAVLITATIWLALATYFELPVSSQQSTQGALLGTVLVTEGISSLPTWNKNKNHNFNGGGLLWIIMEWTMAPIIACVGTFCFFGLLKVFILRHDKAEKRALLFVPICYGASTGLLCLFFMYQVIPLKVTIKKWETAVAVTLATLMGVLLSLLVLLYMARRRFDDQGKPRNSGDNKSSELGLIESTHDEESNMKSKNEDEKFEDALKEFMQLRVLDTVYEEDEKSWASPNTDIVSDPVPASSQLVLEQPTRFKQLLESTPNRLVQRKPLIKMEKTTSKEKVSEFFKELEKSSFYPLVEYDRHTLVRHALAEKFDETEKLFGFPQLLASCILAFIQSSTEIAAVMSPLGAIVDIFYHRAKFSGNGEDAVSVHVNWWIRGIGGVAASIGFFAWGWKLTQCLGGKLTYMSNSRGLVSQLCTVATVIMMTRLNLPVSTSHTFVGSLLGIGIADDPWNVNWKLLIKFLFGWVFTVLFCSGVAYGIYSFTIFSPGYVVP